MRGGKARAREALQTAAISEAVQPKQELAAANPKVYFSVINGGLRNSRAAATELSFRLD